jgi:hypothetical protein
MRNVLEPTDKDFEQMMRTLIGFWETQITGAVAAYSLADHLANGPATAEQIAALEGIDPIATFRLLRACASLGFVTFDGTRFEATPLLGTLRKDAPGSLHSLAMAFAAPGHWRPWGRFLEAVRTRRPQTAPALGVDLWDYYEQEPEEGATFTRAMHGLSSGIIQEIVHIVDTSAVKLAVDVGGARGTLVHGLMAANPQLQGMVVDLPDVVRSAETAAVALGLAGRFRAIASDFFDYIPEADLYLLKYILHDWNDAEAVRILKRCREAMRPDGRVIVIERLLGNIGQPGLAPLTDLNMMVLLTGQERTLDEYCALFRDAGLHFNKSTSIRTDLAVIEAVAV